MVGACETPAFRTAVRESLLVFSEAVPALESHVGLPTGSLRVPDGLLRDPDHTSVKRFFVGALENPGDHEWWPVLSRLSVEDRTTIQGSLFLARKMLPTPEAPWQSHLDRVASRPAGSSPPGLKRFVRRFVRRWMPKGWDRDYESHVASFVPGLSSCLGSPKSKGGARALWVGDREWFFRATLGIVNPEDAILGDLPFPVRFQNVRCDGKSRSVTVAPCWQHLLGPLHRTCYSVLSRAPWLLRGEAVPGRFRDFVSVPGEVFVSGDYESASDYLSHEVLDVIFEEMRSGSGHIPSGIWDLGRESLLGARIEYPDGLPRPLVRGALMGTLLTFPLLCLYNAAIFHWSHRAPCPVKVNGDDIVFRTTPERARKWMQDVSLSGLVLSAGKTLVSASIFSLNSTFFRALSSRVKRLPVIRWAHLTRPSGVPHGLAGRLRTFCRGFVGEPRVVLHTLFLRKNKHALRACGRSVMRDLGCPVEPEALVRVGMGRMEAFFLSLPPCPLPLDQVRLGASSLPEGWSRVPLAGPPRERRAQRASEEAFYRLLVNRAWSDAPVPEKDLVDRTWAATISSGNALAFRRYRQTSQMRGLGALGRCSTYRLLASRQRVDLGVLWTFRPPPRVRTVWSGCRPAVRLHFVRASEGPL